MGRSKFPGKPSKLVNKKRVSVLQTSESDLNAENSLEDDTDYLLLSLRRNDQISSHHNSVSSSLSSLSPSSLSPSHSNQNTLSHSNALCLDRNCENGTITTVNIAAAAAAAAVKDDGDFLQNTKKKSLTSVLSTESGGRESGRSESPSSSVGVSTRARTATPTVFTSILKTSLKSSTATVVVPSSETVPKKDSDEKSTSGETPATKLPVKKKTVTFKNVLETSDDASAVKKVYNPDHGTPLVSIIKKERSTRSKFILRPSLLNSAYKIDKLNSLTFRSKFSSLRSSPSPEKEFSTENCLSSPSSLNVLKSPIGKLAVANTTSGDFNNLLSSCNKSETVSSTLSADTTLRSVVVATPDDNCVKYQQQQPTSVQEEDPSAIVGDKRFVLPKRSAHSCRVIKPNKRFLDDTVDLHSSCQLRNNRIAVKKHLKRQQQQQHGQKFNEIASGSPTRGSNSSVEHNEQGKSNDKSANNRVTLGGGLQDSFINRTLSLKINNSSKLGGSDIERILNSNNYNHRDHRRSDETDEDDDEEEEEDDEKDEEEYEDYQNVYQQSGIGGGGAADGNASETSQLATDDDDDDDTQSDDENYDDDVLSNSRRFGYNPFSTNSATAKNKIPAGVSSSTISGLFCSTGSNSTKQPKAILRQPRLQFSSSALPSFGGVNNSLNNALNRNGNATTTSGRVASTPTSGGLFTTLNLLGSPSSSGLGILNVCGVCGSSTSTKPLQQSKKFGISSCEACRKFISKTVKRLATFSSGESSNLLQCIKRDGLCPITPIFKTSSKSFKHAFKERCPACWLKRCIKVAQVPSALKTRLMATLPASLLDGDSMSSLSPFSSKTEFDPSTMSNLFSSTHKLLSNWSDTFESVNNSESLSPLTSGLISKTVSLGNPLADNNTTFGSAPLVKPAVLEKPVFMLSGSGSKKLDESTASNSSKETDTKHEESAKDSVLQKTSTSTTPTSQTNEKLNSSEAESNRIKLRRKDRENLTPSTATTAPATATGSGATTSTSITTASADGPKRQRIDLKGPRVKHVCRSASIVLGQPIATFSTESPGLDSLDTPPRPESPSHGGEVELPQSIVDEHRQNMKHTVLNCSGCVGGEGSPGDTDSHELGLSPPATPIDRNEPENVIDFESMSSSRPDDNSNCDNNVVGKDLSTMEESASSATTNLQSSEDDQTQQLLPLVSMEMKKQCSEEISKPSTRKITSRTLSNTTNQTSGLGTRNLNAFSKKLLKQSPALKTPMISIDFWENYDPAEVSQTGFGLIVTEPIPMRALCFLCGSNGVDPLIFCSCCCEPYHQYCVEDEYNLKHSSLDETMNCSLMDTSLNLNATNVNILTNRLNWLCPRCTVCYTCNMSSGSKVKCQKCQKNYHTTCLGTSKRLLGADRPLICANCLKCKSCSTTKVTKFVGNLPMCSQCFKLRKKGNYCPLCQKCYEENDFDLKMMECGDCQRWVHAKCEGLSDEQYNMLSTLPESIEFICKRCSKANTQASLWREAVAAEFKSGLLSVVKLLSKSRQACALLKLSPRKKAPTCICQPMQTTGRNIQFKRSVDSDSMFRAEDENSQNSSSPSDNDDSNDFLTVSDVYEFKESSSSSLPSPPTVPVKCFCGAANQKILYTTANTPSLVDVKRKVNSNDYVSLAEFNYDMNNVITAAGCDELMIVYKEILSEQFPWFQNETKACTDALEEDMFESCTFSGQEDDEDGIECDQQVPVIDLPDNLDEYFYSPCTKQDTRVCMFCKGMGEGSSQQESRLLYCGQNSWVHTNCAMWSAEVFEEIDGSLQNVHSAISRGRMIKCTQCGNRGATVGCNVKSCGEHYHYPCARKTDCAFLIDKTVYCPSHLYEANRKKVMFEKNFEVLRPVYVELDRKKKKLVEPNKVQFLIGSLEVKRIGKIFPKFSDTCEDLIPVDFLCTRLYWSIKEPWRIVEYTVRTSIQTNFTSFGGGDMGRNFTVDHTNNMNLVQLGLAQITRWHSSLSVCGEDNDFLLRERTMKQFLEVVGQNFSSEETTEEEPQNNADLLPPEIKDAIFEDLPHEILDGISMLDILPKLMIYEDMIAIDSKTEGYFNGQDYNSKDPNLMAVDEMNENSQKEYDLSNGWPISTSVTHVEDAMLSAARPIISSREIKRSKSEVISSTQSSRISCGANRSQQRSSSLTWSCKLDATSAKRRKLSKGLQDIRLAEGVLLSIGRRKEDFPAALDRRRTSQNAEDSMKSKTFTWSAAKKYSQTESIKSSNFQESEAVLHDDKFKISQLDGMDDLTNDADYTEYQQQQQQLMQNVFDQQQQHQQHQEAPVKCDRCNCTYRTHDSYQRHLATCEALSTSESESETASRSPDMQSPVQTNMLTISASDLCHLNGKQNNQPISIMQNFNQATTSSNLNGIPMNSFQNSLMQGASGIFSGGNQGLQNAIQIQNLRNTPIQINQLNQLNQGLSNIILDSSGNQQQAFSANNTLQQQLIPLQSTTVSRSIVATSQPQSQQIFTIAAQNGNQQILTISPQQQTTLIATSTNNTTSYQQKQQITTAQNIKPQLKSKALARIQQAPKSKPGLKPLQIKRTIQQRQQQQETTKIINISVPQSTNTNTAIAVRNPNDGTSGLVFQQSNGAQPIIVQQMNPQNNIVSYVSADGQIQYLNQPQPQYLTNPLVQGAYLQQDASGNLVLMNAGTTSGLQMLGAPLQLSQATQPQVIGTLIQPQSNGIQCGVMSADQMVLGGASTLEMVGNPPMLLTSQPVYYGLETIVQNTVMSSQQFVSTAMQGVLSQNASFSATTTQVFQASKIEPIMEVPAGYVVLNNDGTIMQQPGNQTNIISANVLQQPTLQQLTAAPTQQIHAQAVQPQTLNAQHLQPIYNITTQATPTQQQHITQLQPHQQTTLQQQHQQLPPQLATATTTTTVTVSPQKPIAKSSPIVVTKIQPQIINKVMPTNVTIAPQVTVTTTTNQPQLQQQHHHQQQQMLHEHQQQQKIGGANPIIISSSSTSAKTVTITPKAGGVTAAASGPIIIQTTPTPQPGLAIPAATIFNPQTEGKIIKSKAISSSTVGGGGGTSSATGHHHPLKPKTVAVHPKMNMIRPMSKVASVSIRPKVVSKPLSAKTPVFSSSPSSSSSSSSGTITKTMQSPQHQLIAPKPLSVTTNTQIRLPIAQQQQQQQQQHQIQLQPSQQQNQQEQQQPIQNTSQPKANIYVTQQSAASILEQKAAEEQKFEKFMQAQFNNLMMNIDGPLPGQNQGQQNLNVSMDTSGGSITAQSANLEINNSCMYAQQQHQLQQQEQQMQHHHLQSYQTNNLNHTMTLSNHQQQQQQQQQQSINLPATTCSIQLPSAPYVSHYSSGIPTNVVNPIQQISNYANTSSSNNSNNVVSRPTNRVLPMQTIHQKFSPPTPPAPKISSENGEVKAKDLIEEDKNNFKEREHIITADNVFSELEKDHLESIIQSTVDDFTNSAGNVVDNSDDLMGELPKHNNGQTVYLAAEDCFNDLKQSADEHDDMSESTTTPEVKDKICEILENLAEDEESEKNSAAVLSSSNSINRKKPDFDEEDLEMEQKENVDPDTATHHNSSPCKEENWVVRTQTSFRAQKPCGPRLLYEIQSEDGFTYKSTSITEIWEKVFEAVQVARKAHGLAPLPDGPLADMCGIQMLGLKTNALKYLIEQLPGVEKCSKYTTKYHQKSEISVATSSGYSSDQEELRENSHGSARCEPFMERSDYDMFSWLASRHRKQPVQIVAQPPDLELIPRRGTGSNLPMAMKYRTLKETYKDYVGVFRSHIHGRGLYCTKDIEAGEMVIEYAGELIRSTLTDKRERYYDSKGIGCYMFKIDENLVVDATMRGNAARFINHSCEPNCYSKVVDILGHKHIIIFALRRIVLGEELTYDYKFPFEDVKIPCSCGSKRCRKYLN